MADRNEETFDNLILEDMNINSGFGGSGLNDDDLILEILRDDNLREEDIEIQQPGSVPTGMALGNNNNSSYNALDEIMRDSGLTNPMLETESTGDTRGRVYTYPPAPVKNTIGYKRSDLETISHHKS